MGGLDAGPVERAEHDYAPWEKRVDAILRLLSDRKRRILVTDELRRDSMIGVTLAASPTR